MAFAKIQSAQNRLLQPSLVSVEVDLSRGLHSFSIVGLPGKATEESKDRVSAAIKNSGFKSPKQSNVKTVISLAPAELRKEGSAFDVPMAIGYLLANGDIFFDPSDKLFAGELALDGSLRPVRGALAYARLAKKEGIGEILVPSENSREASLIEGIRVFGFTSLSELIDHLERRAVKNPEKGGISPRGERRGRAVLDGIAGNENAKRCLTIAAAGKHNLALFGPPGTGKTMLARAIPDILPPLSRDEALEVTEIHSYIGNTKSEIIDAPPLRSPHHASSRSSLLGGGSFLTPGEITLAHRGVLLLDEFLEFDRGAIEGLRQPLEEKVIDLSRAQDRTTFPADFMLVAAFNLCPCGNRGAKGRECVCSPKDLSRYSRKLSGPIADRIDIWTEVSKVDYAEILATRTGSSQTENARESVSRARAFREARKGSLQISTEGREILRKMSEASGMSARGCRRTAAVARTIADMDQSVEIKTPHVLEAFQYRNKF